MFQSIDLQRASEISIFWLFLNIFLWHLIGSKGAPTLVRHKQVTFTHLKLGGQLNNSLISSESTIFCITFIQVITEMSRKFIPILGMV